MSTPTNDTGFNAGVKTSESSNNEKTTGDNEVQQGIGVETTDKRSYDKGDDQQEYIEQANNNTALANEDPAQGG